MHVANKYSMFVFVVLYVLMATTTELFHRSHGNAHCNSTIDTSETRDTQRPEVFVRLASR